MPENAGFYQKYHISRVDGRPIETTEGGTPLTFTLEFTRDPFALVALKAYRDAADEAGGYGDLVADLDYVLTMINEDEVG